jgi:vacuolar-type H+-ATPase subunit H
MVNVLDVLETIKSSSTTPRKTVEASKTQIETKLSEAEAVKSQTETEAGASEPVKEKSLETRKEETEKETAEQIQSEKTTIPTPEAEKGYLKKKSEKLNTMSRN